MKRLLFAATLFGLVAPKARACDAETSEQLVSPAATVSALFCLIDGKPHYSLDALGRPVIATSALGFRLQSEPSLAADFAIQDLTRRRHAETWHQVWGEAQEIKDEYNELTVTLRQSSSGRLLRIVLRAYDDGFAFRYEVPEQEGLGEFVIMDELTEFAFANHAAWWIPAYERDRYEQLYRHTPLAEIPNVHTPLTIEGDGAFYAVHEAALDDYASMTLKRGEGGRLVADLVPWHDGTKVKTRAGMKSPWRTVAIAPRAIDLLTNHLTLNLNEPNRLADTSWIKPQKFLGIWWGMHIGRFSWGTGQIHGATTERAKAYVDHAKALGIESVLVEGWNVGWDGPWGDGFDFTHTTADFDLEAVTTYAAAQGIGIVGHHETSGAIRNYERQVDDAFRLYRERGIRVVKSGYVGTQVEGGEWHDGQFMVRHHRMMAEKAAAYGLMLDTHEPVKDTGLRRTFPNLMTREGGRGTEWDAWDADGGNPPGHTVTIPFTVGLAGPFDFTPGIFDLLTGATPRNRVWTTLAKQLALYVVIYSPLQMAADLPENYAGHPAFQFIRDVAVDWQQTVPLNGAIGEFVTIARQARNSDDWFIGSITNEQPREFGLPLRFLQADRSYCARIYQDAADTNYLTKPETYEIRSETVTRESVLAVRLAPGGGQAVHLASGACAS